MTKVVRGLILPLALAIAVGAVGLDAAVGQDKDKKAKKDKTAKEPKAVATAVFEVHKSPKNEQYYFKLTDADGVLLAVCAPKGYKTKAEALKAIEAIKASAAKAKIEDADKGK